MTRCHQVDDQIEESMKTIIFGRREVEETHKDLLQSVGKTLRGEQWEHLNWKFKKIDNLNWKSVGKTLRGEH